MGGDGCLHGRFTYYFVLGWPPVRKVLPKLVFFLIASIVGIFLFPFFGGIWAVVLPRRNI
jgi:hypothetical protein